MKILINNVVRLVLPLGLFIWSLFQPVVASSIFSAIIVVLSSYLLFIDIIGRPKPGSINWSKPEIEIMKKYHLALRYPFGARDMSAIVNGLRWSALIWVPWMLWNHLWVCGAIVGVNFFVMTSLSVRLDPFYFLSDAVNRGNTGFEYELRMLHNVSERLKLEKGGS